MAGRALTKAISATYLLAIVCITLVYGERYGNGHTRGEVYLVPLSAKKYYINNITVLDHRGQVFLLKELIGNLLLFMPFYWAVSSLYGKKIEKGYFIIFTTLSVLLIESLQYLFSIGTFDIDDVILNILGSIFGIYFYKALCKKYCNEDTDFWN